MKKVVSVSIGSSKRNHAAEIDVLGEKLLIERIGTDGSLQKASEMVLELDGKVDCFGLGGTDLYVFAGSKRYTFRDSAKIAKNAKKTPIVDGSGLKNTLERRTINYLNTSEGIDFTNKKVLMVCGMDRFGMAETLEEVGANVTYGDLIFALGVSIPLHSLSALDKVARIIAPIVVQLPFKLLYPTGKKQEVFKANNKYKRFYDEADVIAGDYHFIRKHMPLTLEGKMIITNTVTKDDIQELKDKGVSLLVTTTPHLNGRSFGTNVMEAALVALSGKDGELSSNEYVNLLDKLDFVPHVKWLQQQDISQRQEVTHG
ncbi:MAG: quinate 5-dehydrogenase [Desulfitibacter sp. BRH_c19]|nr:MAG: quinate 5-dehydrogenase [Desulfitibacter sp. BRH_c19]